MYKMYCFLVISCISSFLVYNVCSKDKEEIIKERELPTINKIEVKKEEIVERISTKIEEKELIIIEIPKINLKGKIYNKNSILNNIDKNIVIMNESDMPSDKGGIIIIGAHSGYGIYAYFKDLNKLDIDDMVILTYQNKKYYYKVVEFHLDSKDGSISINNINKKNKLFLFTCNPNDKNNYLVYNLELFK